VQQTRSAGCPDGKLGSNGFVLNVFPSRAHEAPNALSAMRMREHV
jgi:hypothetical protein